MKQLGSESSDCQRHGRKSLTGREVTLGQLNQDQLTGFGNFLGILVLWVWVGLSCRFKELLQEYVLRQKNWSGERVEVIRKPV